MTEKLKPCPLCHRPAEHAENDPGDWWGVCCTVKGCLFASWSVSEDIWQALPRQSDAAREIAAEMVEHAQMVDEHGVDTTPNMLTRWAKRVAQIAEPDVPAVVCGGDVPIDGPFHVCGACRVRLAGDADCDSCVTRIEYEGLHYRIVELETRNRVLERRAKEAESIAGCRRGDRNMWRTATTEALAKRDAALAEVTVLRKGINALVEQLTEWQCAKDEHKAGIWPALLIQDPEQWCLDALRALLDKGERQGQAWVDTFFDPR